MMANPVVSSNLHSHFQVDIYIIHTFVLVYVHVENVLALQDLYWFYVEIESKDKQFSLHKFNDKDFGMLVLYDDALCKSWNW